MFTFLLFILWLATVGLLLLTVVNHKVYEWLVRLLAKVVE